MNGDLVPARNDSMPRNLDKGRHIKFPRLPIQPLCRGVQTAATFLVATPS
jgi:hypothetical protein